MLVVVYIIPEDRGECEEIAMNRTYLQEVSGGVNSLLTI
jgi:hypothetical protein